MNQKNFARVSVGLLYWMATSGGPAWSGEDQMINMPKIQPKKTYTVKDQQAGEDLLDNRGYGDQESSVRMMNLMMVEGSGMEGMDMGEMKAMKMAAKATSPTPSEGQTAHYDFKTQIIPSTPQVGANTLEITLQNKATKKPATGMKLKVQVSMMSMDMGTEQPRVREVRPGVYQVKVNFSMKGPWAVKVSLPEGGEKTLTFKAGS